MYTEQGQAKTASETLRDRNTVGGAMCGQLGVQAGLRERIADQRRRAESEATKCGRLQELEYLLDKNPEVARILELLDFVRM